MDADDLSQSSMAKCGDQYQRLLLDYSLKKTTDSGLAVKMKTQKETIKRDPFYVAGDVQPWNMILELDSENGVGAYGQPIDLSYGHSGEQYKSLEVELRYWQSADQLALFPNHPFSTIPTRTEFEEMVRRARRFYEHSAPSDEKILAKRMRQVRHLLSGPEFSPENGAVYLVHRPDTDEYKIGVSERPHVRLYQIANAEGAPVDLVHSFPSDSMYWAESELHGRFANRRSRGPTAEWFHLTDSDVAFIKAIHGTEDGEWLVEPPGRIFGLSSSQLEQPHD